MKVDLQFAYILHRIPYRDSSAIIHCLTALNGLVSMVAKGVKRPRSRLACYMQPFMRLQVAWVGGGELKTLTQVEAENFRCQLVGEKILLGLYINELLLRLLQKHDPQSQLFVAYDATIVALAQSKESDAQQVILRKFELKLLAELGYGLDLTKEAKTQQPIEADLLYTYDPTIGLLESSMIKTSQVIVSGASIIALEKEQFHSQVQLREAKQLMRLILSYHLGDKPLQTRKLFV